MMYAEELQTEIEMLSEFTWKLIYYEQLNTFLIISFL